MNIDIVWNALSTAVAILSTRSVKAMAVEYPSLWPYWLSDYNLSFSMYLFNLYSSNFSRIFENLDKMEIGL